MEGHWRWKGYSYDGFRQGVFSDQTSSRSQFVTMDLAAIECAGASAEARPARAS